MAKTKRQKSITKSSVPYGKKDNTRKVDDQDGATTARKEESHIRDKIERL